MENCNSHCMNGSEEYYMNAGFPWPPRSYSCSFCRKEFKSAQALGGHMNVHRRERARLRQSSPIDLNLNPSCSTPSFSLLPSSSSNSSSSNVTPKPAVTSTLPLFFSPTPSSSSCIVVDGILLNPLSSKPSEHSKPKIAENDAFPGEEVGCQMLKKAEILRMDLEIGLPTSYDLDLELRLGSNY